MGVPKFFRYISERYPCLSELAREQSIPDFDNLYLDMNGIIHNCSHPDDTNIHFNITEEDMFKDIFNYIDKLFFLIKPQQLFFMAVDGVAPRAKMNQQRSRRFRSAKDAELLEQKALRRGEVRAHERFDSNCITPGTEFMTRLQEALRYFIKSKISTDPLWQKCRVILSGHDTPGEGEHKIMDYIRYLKSQADYNPNTRHCLYGLDADLIILGLCTHELHFVVLREEVKFGRKTKRTSVEETRFFLLHLGLLREYLQLEFEALHQQDESFDIAKLIDDWVLMGFLVGNDFIPHLPCLHISSNALPLLYKTYIKVYPTLGGNINEAGKLNLQRLEQYFAALSEVEYEIFQENYADLKYFQAKQTKNGIDEAFDFDVNEINNENTDNDLAALIESSRQFLEDENDDSADESQHIIDEFETYKRNYYMNKLNQNDMSSQLKREQAICYITALQWILDYYYCGVQSWDWYYPHHYAPFISDLRDFKDYKIRFSMGKPFLPFEQLLAVLPAASKELLPAAYRELMTDAESALIDYYPSDFQTDLNGKKHEWEAVVLIPFIDEKILLHAMKTCESKLTANELARNKHGPMLQYDYSAESQGNAPGIYALKTLNHVFCTERPIWASEIAVASDKTVCIELSNAARTVFFPGFPTMKHLKFDFELRNARVKVFDHASRNENLILMPHNRNGFDDIFTVAEKYLNQIIFIGWPHLIKGKVVSIFNKEKIIDTEGIRDIEPKIHQLQMRAVQEHLTTRMGIEFNDFTVLVNVRTHSGSSYVCGSQGKVTVVDTWSAATTAYPAHGVVAEIAVHNALQEQHKKIEQLFPTDSTIFFVGNPYFGSEGTVLNPMLVYECGRLKVNITVLPEPDFNDAKYIQSQLERDYVNTYQAAATLGIHAKCLGRITGSILVIAGARRTELADHISKANIGLQFKYPKQQEERTGYARRINNQWYYSSKAIDLIQSYCEKFPVVVDYISCSSDRQEFCFEADFFPDSVGEGCIEEIVTWLKAQPHMQVDRISCGSKSVEKEAIEKILEAIERLKTLPVKTVKLQVKPHLLLKPDVSLPDMYKARRPIKLFDRVVIVKTTYLVPLGAKGTVVGIYPVSDPNPVRLECVRAIANFYEVLFDKHLPNGNDIHGIAKERVYIVPETAVLLIFTQDNKQNEMSAESKLSKFVDNSAEKATEQQQQQPKQQQQQTLNDSNVCTAKTTTATTNTSAMYATPNSSNNHAVNMQQTRQQQQQQQQQQQLPIKKGSDDFWQPAANTKQKHANIAINSNALEQVMKTAAAALPPNAQTNVVTILQKPMPIAAAQQFTPPVLQQQQPAAASHNECQAERVLKNLLGLSQTPQVNDSVKQLPQPPTCWKNDAQHAVQLTPPAVAPAAAVPPQQQQQQANYPTMPVVTSYKVTPTNINNASVLPNYAAQNPFPQPVAQQYRKPNAHSFKAPPRSAFIPLQALRPGRPMHNRRPNQQQTDPHSSIAQMQQNLRELTLQVATGPDSANTDTDTQPESNHGNNSAVTPTTTSANVKAAETRTKKTRVPKIGARFDFKQ